MDNKTEVVVYLAHYGYDHLINGMLLMKKKHSSWMHPSCSKKNYKVDPYETAHYLYHLGFELILKSCCAYTNKGKFIRTHDTAKLIKDCKYLKNKLSDESKDILKRINKFYYHRYPNDNEIGDSLGSISTDIKKTLLDVYVDILSTMPKKYKEDIKKIIWTKKGRKFLMQKPIK